MLTPVLLSMKNRLTPTQLQVLKSLPKSLHPKYGPLVALLNKGLAKRIPVLPEHEEHHPTFGRTPEGNSYLKTQKVT
jgi:hypothetical protein